MPASSKNAATRSSGAARRHFPADVDGTIALNRRTNALRTALNETNRQRNEHQKAGKQKLDPAARDAHTVEGRRLKDEVAAQEETLRLAGDRARGGAARAPELPASRIAPRRRSRLQGPRDLGPPRNSTSHPRIT
ncbi:MAG: hypothetical protein IPK00_25980 [Deltaproteobacteria bacterium]|nr:hypothetical protein [Deltaproteobacteria bacterium]